MHMHTLKIAIMQPAEIFDLRPPDRRRSSPGSNQLPPFRRRVLPVPFQLHHPLWVEDRDFDPDQHIFLHGCPPRAAWAVRGRDRADRQHAARPVAAALGAARLRGDATAASASSRRCTTRSPTVSPPTRCSPTSWTWARTPDVEPEPWPEATPHTSRRGRRQGRAGRRREAGRDPSGPAAGPCGAAAVVRHKRAAAWRPRARSSTPRTRRSTGPSPPRRSFATVSLPLEDFKRVKKAHGSRSTTSCWASWAAPCAPGWTPAASTPPGRCSPACRSPPTPRARAPPRRQRRLQHVHDARHRLDDPSSG